MKQYIKTIVGTLLLLSFTLSMHADMRTFTSQDGREMKAELLFVDGENVKMKRPNGTSFTTKISIFSDADQAFIREWSKKAAMLNADIEISTKTKVLNTNKYESGAKNYKEKEMAYDVIITNDSDFKYEGVVAKYMIFKFDHDEAADRGNDGHYRYQSGSFEIGDLGAREEQEFQTASVTLIETKLKSGWVYSNKGDRKSKDKLAGVWVRLYVGDEIIEETVEPKKLAKEFKWSDGASNW